MSWDKPTEESKEEQVQQEEVKVEPEATEEPVKVESEQAEAQPEQETVEAAEDKPQEPQKDEQMIPQAVLGRVVKKVREKSNNKIAEYEQRLKQLEDENKRLKESDTWETDEPEEPAISESLVEQKVRQEFLRRQDAYGHQKYGEHYEQAVELLNSINDPVLTKKITESANPADMLIEEMTKVAQDMELGSTPQEREAKKREMMEAEIRKKVEAEMAEKLKARNNQPTSVQGLRTASGADVAEKPRSGWTTTLPK